ncbi:MAG: hypothetical protein ACOYMG_08295, partial [Candidatus Methylumidiphilus sp.]
MEFRATKFGSIIQRKDFTGPIELPGNGVAKPKPLEFGAAKYSSIIQRKDFTGPIELPGNGV